MKRIEVAAAIIIKNNRLFATQRGYGDFKDYWEFPGGKIEAGETPGEALIREIREEREMAARIREAAEPGDINRIKMFLEKTLSRMEGMPN